MKFKFFAVKAGSGDSNMAVNEAIMKKKCGHGRPQSGRGFFDGVAVKACRDLATLVRTEGEFLVGFEGLESTLRIGLAVGRPWSQNH